MTDLVHMTKGNLSGDYHPSNVEDMLKHDWVIAAVEAATKSHVTNEDDAESLEVETDEPVAATVLLSDIIDDRSLPGLLERNIVSLQDFADADDETLLAVKFITEARLAKYRAEVAEALG